MSNHNSGRSGSPRGDGNTLLTGVLVGLVAGVAMAAGVAWYLMKSPSPYLKTEQAAVRPPLVAAKPAAPNQPTAGQPSTATSGAASGVGGGKPRFEFYKVLTDKPDAAVVTAKPAEATVHKAVALYEPQILQAGSFSNENDAEKLKAKLALLGVETGIQAATLPDKGVWYRVRLGPYKSADEMNHARNFLKQNGVDSTPMRAP